MLDITERAAGVVRQSAEAARRFNPDARIRLIRAAAGLAFELTDERDPTDVELDCRGAMLLVAADIDGTIDTGDHNAPVLLSAP